MIPWPPRGAWSTTGSGRTRALSPDQLNMLRYGRADLTDDLVHATDPVEAAATAATPWQAVADGFRVAGER